MEMSKRRIALVNQPWGHVAPPVTTGGSIPLVLYELARRLMERGDDVSYYTRSRFRPYTIVDNGITFRYQPVVADRLVQKLCDRLPRSQAPNRPRWASDWSYCTYGLLVAMDAHRHAAQIIHLNNLSQFIPIIRQHNPDAVIVLHMHCEWLSQLAPDLIRPRIEQADLILGVSDFITSRVRDAFPHLAHRCRTLYNGVNTEQFSPSPAERDHQAHIVYVGRITPEKGVHTLIDAFRIVRSRLPQARLTLAGPDEINPPELVVSISNDPMLPPLEPLFDSQRYRALLDERLQGLQDAVRFTGNVPHGPALADLYRTGDVCVFPSIWDEPFGIPVIEAMATGTAVVATRGGAFPEIIEDGHSGLLVDRGDAEALAQALLRILGDADLRRRLGRAARQRVEQAFTWDRAARLLSDYYDEAAHRSRRHS
jgi:glycosyltransferase involved in cell wall biosynthesis